MMTHSQKETAPSYKKLPKAVLTGLAAGTIVCVLLLALFGVVLLMRDVPQPAVLPMSVAAMVIGAFAGGFIGARIYRQNGLLMGLTVATLMFLLAFISGFLISANPVGTVSLLKLGLSLLGGAVGGIAGVNKRKRKK